MPTMAHRKAPGVMVLAHNERSPDPEEWAEWIEAMAKHDLRNTLVWTDGGAPDASQRALIAERLGTVKATVMSESSIAKPVSTVLRWVGHDIRVFAFREMDQALDYAGVPPAARELVLRASLEARIEVLGGRMRVDALAIETVRERLSRTGADLAELIRRTA